MRWELLELQGNLEIQEVVAKLYFSPLNRGLLQNMPFPTAFAVGTQRECAFAYRKVGAGAKTMFNARYQTQPMNRGLLQNMPFPTAFVVGTQQEGGFSYP